MIEQVPFEYVVQKTVVEIVDYPYLQRIFAYDIGFEPVAFFKIDNVMRSDIEKWCLENCKNKYKKYNFFIAIESPCDATLFKLKWC